jgi:hypothetical protein
MRLRRTATLLALAATVMTFLGTNVSHAAPETTALQQRCSSHKGFLAVG